MRKKPARPNSSAPRSPPFHNNSVEEYAARFALGGTSPGPSRREVSRSRVTLNRGTRNSLTRRDPHGTVVTNRPVISAYGINWDFPFSDDTTSLQQAFAYLVDPGTEQIGFPKSLIEATAHAGLADGTVIKLEHGILREFQITFETRQPLKFQSSFQFGTMSTVESFPVATAHAGTGGAGPPALSLTLGTRDITTFAGTIAFNREAAPAGFDIDGNAASFGGRLAVDIVGRITARLSASDAHAALRDRFIDSLAFQVTSPAPFSLVIPRATFQVTSRRVVSPSLTDYSIDFLATADAPNPLATYSFT